MAVAGVGQAILERLVADVPAVTAGVPIDVDGRVVRDVVHDQEKRNGCPVHQSPDVQPRTHDAGAEAEGHDDLDVDHLLPYFPIRLTCKQSEQMRECICRPRYFLGFLKRLVTVSFCFCGLRRVYV